MDILERIHHAARMLPAKRTIEEYRDPASVLGWASVEIAKLRTQVRLLRREVDYLNATANQLREDIDKANGIREEAAKACEPIDPASALGQALDFIVRQTVEIAFLRAMLEVCGKDVRTAKEKP